MSINTHELRQRYANRWGGHKLVFDAADEIDRLRETVKLLTEIAERTLGRVGG